MRQAFQDTIRQKFSQAASQYDMGSALHRTIADELLAKVIEGAGGAAILDVGCGTGYLTSKLKAHFPQSKVIGLDFAQGMLEEARLKDDQISWLLADGHYLPFPEGNFNIVVSNLAYQWADLSKVFLEAQRVLIPGGRLISTLFGYNSCQELFQSISEASQGTIQFDRLPDQEKIQRALKESKFTEFKITSEKILMTFKDMYELISWFKLIGAPHLAREGYIGKKLLAQAAAIYNNRFTVPGGVVATFEIYYVQAQA